MEKRQTCEHEIPRDCPMRGWLLSTWKPFKTYMPLCSESQIRKMLYKDFGLLTESMPEDTNPPLKGNWKDFQLFAAEQDIPKFGFEMEDENLKNNERDGS